MVAPSNSAERLQDSGFGVIMFSLTQRLLSLKERPKNPVEWIQRRLKEKEYFITESSFETFLQNALQTAAYRHQKPSSSSGPRPVAMVTQLLVEVGCDMSHHYTKLQGGRLMDDVKMLRIAGQLADYFMWIVISSSIEGSLHPATVKSEMSMLQYVGYAGAGLKCLVSEVRSLTAERREQHMDLTVLDALFDLTEVLLKLRCFAAQAEIDVSEEHCPAPFPAAGGRRGVDAADDDGLLGLAVASRRSFRLVFIQMFARSVDGYTTASPLTSVETLERLFLLTGQLLSSAGFPSSSVHCIATDAPLVAHEKALYESMQIRSEQPVGTDALWTTMQPLAFLQNTVAHRLSPSLSTDNVTVVARVLPQEHQTSSTTSNSPPSSPTGSASSCQRPECPSRLCNAIQHVCRASHHQSALLSDIAPPCIVLLPVDGACSVVVAPLPLLVGVVVAAHIGKAMEHRVPPTPLPVVQGAGDEGKKGGKKPAASTKKNPNAASEEGGAQQAPPDATGGTEQAQLSVAQPAAPSRRAVFGDAFEYLFGASSDVADGGLSSDADKPSFMAVLLKPLPSISRTKQQIACTHAMALGLAQVLGLPSSLKPGKTFTSPMIGAIGFSWDPQHCLQHSITTCWWSQLGGPALQAHGGPVHLEQPLIRCLMALRALLRVSPLVFSATALNDNFAQLPLAHDGGDGPPAPQVATSTLSMSILRACLLPLERDEAVVEPEGTPGGTDKPGGKVAGEGKAESPGSPTAMLVETARNKLRSAFQQCGLEAHPPMVASLLTVLERLGPDVTLADAAQGIVRARPPAASHTK